MKQLSAAENDIIIGNYTIAYKTLADVLTNDIYNYRALDLFCKVNNLLGSPEKLFELITAKPIDFHQIRPNTLVSISKTLSLIKNNEQATNLSKELIEIVAVSKRQF